LLTSEINWLLDIVDDHDSRGLGAWRLFTEKRFQSEKRDLRNIIDKCFDLGLIDLALYGKRHMSYVLTFKGRWALHVSRHGR